VLALFHGVFALAASTHFGLSPAFTGALLSGMAVVTMLTQAFLIDWVTRSFDTAQVYRANVLTLALSFAGIALSTSIVGVVLCVVPMTIASSILFTANTAQLNKAASPGDRGTLNAIDMSVSSFVRVFSPSLGTWILRTQGFSAIGAIGALTLALLFLAIELSRSIVVRPGLELGTGL
jgi:OCT family organic cation transporter-like MFS transporter 18